ncbi:GNAT family N-acetyltransferase [Bacteroidota bacterium]
MRQDLLASNKITLREMHMDDLERIHDWENRSELWYLGDVHQPLTRSEIKDFMQSSTGDILLDGQLRLMIGDKNGNTVGCIDLFDFDAFNEKAGVGILIAETADRKNGYAKEALTLVSNYCFQVFKLKQLYCHITVDNQNSLMLFKACGYVETGRCKDWVKKGQTFIDTLFLQKINAVHG